MTPPQLAPEIDTLLNELKSEKEKDRLLAVRELTKCGANAPRVIAALEELAAHEPYASVVDETDEALRALGHPRQTREPNRFPSHHRRRKQSPSGSRWRKQYRTDNEKFLDIGIGFVAWFVVNGVVWLILLKGGEVNADFNLFFNVFILPANLIALLILAIFRNRIALGMLIAIAANLVVALMLSLGYNGMCAIPFFVK